MLCIPNKNEYTLPECENAICLTKVILLIIEGLSLLQSIPPTTANKQESRASK